MEEKQVKKLPPFSHIKVLENGNYGCTLLVADKIYNGVFSPSWECIEKLHLVEVDAYNEYDFVLADHLIPMPDEDEEDIAIENYEAYAERLILNFEDDDKPLDGELYSPALFCIQYLDKNGEVAVNQENSLIPYRYFVYSLLENVFDKFYMCGCDKDCHTCKLCWDKVEHYFNIEDVELDMPFAKALKGVYNEYNTFEDKVVEYMDANHSEVDKESIQYDICSWEQVSLLENDLKQRLHKGAYGLCEICYLTYLIDNCKEVFEETRN